MLRIILTILIVLAILFNLPLVYGENSNIFVSVPLGSTDLACASTNECYIPSIAAVDVGGKITWSNNDSVVHTVVSGTPEFGPDGLFGSDIIMTGSDWSFKFDGFDSGSYPYFCLLHPMMTGVVNVEESKDTILLRDDQIVTETQIPDWIRNNAAWWADNQIDDDTFVSGIQYLIKEGIISVSSTSSSSNTTNEIPQWIKNNADWWSQELISDDEFLKGIEFLVENGIIVIS